MKNIQDLILKQQELIGAPVEIYDYKYSSLQDYDHKIDSDGYVFIHKNQMKYINDMVLAANVELSEMLQELPWKPWKDMNDQEFNLTKAQEELADAFIFLYNIARIFGMNVEYFVTEKIKMNIKRLETGIHQEHE